MNDSDKHKDDQASKAKAEIGESSKLTPRNFPAQPPSASSMQQIESLSPVKSSPQLPSSGSEGKGPSIRLRRDRIATSASKSVASPSQLRKGKNRAIDVPTATRSTGTIRKESPPQHRYQTRSVSKSVPCSRLGSTSKLQERDASLRTPPSERQSAASTSYNLRNVAATPSCSQEYLPVDSAEDEVILSPSSLATSNSREIPLTIGK
jgi:hypothetical protein